MRVERLTYRSFDGGFLGMEVGLGGAKAPLSLSPVELMKFVFYLRNHNPLQLVLFSGQVCQIDEEIDGALRTLLENGVKTGVRWDGQCRTTWMEQCVLRVVDIDSTPWLQCAVTSIVYHLDQKRQPLVEEAHIKRGTALKVAVGKPRDLEEARDFIKESHLEWSLAVPPKWSIEIDLSKTKAEALKR